MNKLAVQFVDPPGGNSGGVITNPVLGNLGRLSGEEFFKRFFPAAVGMAFVIGSLIFLFNIIIGSIQWISSGNDKQNLETARQKITNSFWGIIVLFASLAIIKVIEDFFHVDILAIDIGPLKIQ